MLPTAPEQSAQPARSAALDAARGIAVLTMFVAHGYDGWLAPEHKAGFAFRVTRELAAVAMPSFVVFAGMGLGLTVLRMGGATDAPALEAVRRTRIDAIAHALRLMLIGYALALAHALVDGGLNWPTLLHADALHAIGASLALCAATLVRPSSAALRTRAAALALLLLAITRPLSLSLTGVPAPLAYALAPFVRIEGITRFAALPLAALCAGGIALVGSGLPARLGSARMALMLSVGGGLLAAAFWLVTAQLLNALPGPLSPAHVAVLPNALDGFCRALCALGLGALAAMHAPALLRSALLALGRRSLWVYALHVPLCYGRLASPLRGQLDFGQASLAVCVLAVVTAAMARLSLRRGSEPVQGADPNTARRARA